MGRGRPRLFNDKEKWCGKCERWLPLDAFGENASTTSKKAAYCQACHNGYCKQFFTKVASVERRLMTDYGLSPNHYWDLWRAQNERCAICEHILVLYHRNTHVDFFDGRVRGLLCKGCLQGVEGLRREARLFERAAKYYEAGTIAQPAPASTE